MKFIVSSPYLIFLSLLFQHTFKKELLWKEKGSRKWASLFFPPSFIVSIHEKAIKLVDIQPVVTLLTQTQFIIMKKKIYTHNIYLCIPIFKQNPDVPYLTLRREKKMKASTHYCVVCVCPQVNILFSFSLTHTINIAYRTHTQIVSQNIL